ncbi:hypothetical protein [Prochlorothrix hollandica]|uniref:hypothetical protein n=1 Tax=Prochlorothrix hollandica TaxID=1223 RepID=UPI00034A1325|nr:hypothetical protein [Prochlorothrix hollandica]
MAYPPKGFLAQLWHHPRLQSVLHIGRKSRVSPDDSINPVAFALGFLRSTFAVTCSDFRILGILWLVYACIHQLWLVLDRTPPSWDPGKHLTGSLNYWWVLSHAQWLSADWWTHLWMLSSSYVPFLYITTAPLRSILGLGADAGITINLVYGSMVLGAVYGLGQLAAAHSPNPRLGLWAAGLCLLMPRLYNTSLDYLVDYGAMAWATVSFLLLTLWTQRQESSPPDGSTPRQLRQKQTQDSRSTHSSPTNPRSTHSSPTNPRSFNRRSWGLAIAFGVCLACTLFTKQTLLLFFVVPLGWVMGAAVWTRHWQRLAQLLVAGGITGGLLLPWVSTNLIFLFGAGSNSLVTAATNEGDPAVNTWAAWLYYLRDLPAAVSWPLLVVPVVGWLLYGGNLLKLRSRPHPHPSFTSLSPTAPSPAIPQPLPQTLDPFESSGDELTDVELKAAELAEPQATGESQATGEPQAPGEKTAPEPTAELVDRMHSAPTIAATVESGLEVKETELPKTELPATELPKTELPKTEFTETTLAETTEQASAEQTSVQITSTESPSAEQTSAEQTSADLTSAEQTSAEQTSADLTASQRPKRITLPGAVAALSSGVILEPAAGMMADAIAAIPPESPADPSLTAAESSKVPFDRASDRASEQSPDRTSEQSPDRPRFPNLFPWFAAYILGGYGLWSLISNKDSRYIMPYLPILALFLASGLGYWQRRWWRVRWLTGGFALVLMLLNLFPLGGGLGQGIVTLFSPHSLRWPSLQASWPQESLMQHLATAQPYQVVNLGILEGSATINPDTLTYYGLQQNFRIYARSLGDRESFQDSDLDALNWFVTQQDPNLDVLSLGEPNRIQQTVQKLLQDPRFELDATWPMADGSQLQLYRRVQLPVTVEPLAEPAPALPREQQMEQPPVFLEKIEFSPLAPAGAPIPITYTWVGSWDNLSQGLVLVDWQQNLPPIPDTAGLPDAWIQDHAIGLGTLPPLPIQANQIVKGPPVADGNQWFRVTERTAMMPPEPVMDGVYNFSAQYLNATTGEVTTLAVPPVALTLDADVAPVPSPAPDWVTQLRQLAPRLGQGRQGLDQVFDRLGRINLYDPIQNYLVQAEKTLEVRLDLDPDNLDYAYALGLARVMQRDKPGALAAMKRVASLDASNPMAHAYVAFIHLVSFQPRKAHRALKPALALEPDNLEFRAIEAIASLMQGNLWGAWHQGRSILQALPN